MANYKPFKMVPFGFYSRLFTFLNIYLNLFENTIFNYLLVIFIYSTYLKY